MQRDPSVPLWDVNGAGADIGRFIGGMTHGAYLQDRRTEAAVERKLEIVGEALKTACGAVIPSMQRGFPIYPRIIGFRNIPAHAYDIVAPEDVWDYARNDLLELRKAVQALPAELGPPDE